MNLEPIRALLELAEKATNAPWTLDHDNSAVATPGKHDWDWVVPPPENDDDRECRGDNFAANNAFVVAARNSVPALSQLLEAVTNLEKLEAEWREGANDPDGPTGGVFQQCADELHRLLHPEDK